MNVNLRANNSDDSSSDSNLDFETVSNPAIVQNGAYEGPFNSYSNSDTENTNTESIGTESSDTEVLNRQTKSDSETDVDR